MIKCKKSMVRSDNSGKRKRNQESEPVSFVDDPEYESDSDPSSESESDSDSKPKLEAEIESILSDKNKTDKQKKELLMDLINNVIKDTVDLDLGEIPEFDNITEMYLKREKKESVLPDELQEKILSKLPTIEKILELDIPDDRKISVIEMFKYYETLEIFSPEWKEYKEVISRIISEPKLIGGNKEKEDEKKEKEETILSRIMNSRMSEENKNVLLDKYKKLERLDREDKRRLENYIEGVLSIPWGKVKGKEFKRPPTKKEMKQVLSEAKRNLDQNVLFMEPAKEVLIQTLFSEIKNGTSSLCLGLHGGPGLGKTTLVLEGVSKALNRPLKVISLGGASDGKLLKGSDSVYVGSNPGRIVEILKETECMNPIIYFDEVDKVSFSGRSAIFGILTHLIDPTQSKYFQDNYFKGINIDLSKVSFVFSFNDKELVNSIVSDRMDIIHVENLTNEQKLQIAQKILIPKLNSGLKTKKIEFTDSSISYILTLTEEVGVRDLKRKLTKVMTRLQLVLTTDELNYNYMKSEQIKRCIKKVPVVVTTEIAKILLEGDENEKNTTHWSLYT